MNKYSALGSLIGIFLGIVLYLIYPQFLSYDFGFNKSFRSSLGFSEGQYLYRGGSVFVVGYLFPVILGFLGWLLGYLYSKRSS